MKRGLGRVYQKDVADVNFGARCCVNPIVVLSLTAPRNGRKFDGSGIVYFVIESLMYQTVTNEIQVSVSTQFLDEESLQESFNEDTGGKECKYFWAYTITIENNSTASVELLTRHWLITDSNGRTMEINGVGVVGETPILMPGESFEYTSGTPLDTQSGIMRGSYEMRTGSGDVIEVAIPAFSLDVPDMARVMN